MRWIDHLRQDVRAAVRNLRKYPVAGLVSILSLAGGIGSSTATLAIRDTIFRNPPPHYTDAGQLSEVFTVTARRFRRPVPAALYRIWTSQSRPAQQWAASRDMRREEIRTADRAPTLSVREVTPSLFTVLGVKPAIGQTFDTLAGDPAATVVLSDRAWRGLFDGRADVVGQTLWIANRAYTVVGVMPPRFWFMDLEASVWTALRVDTLPADAGLTVVARRPDGVEAEALLRELAPGVSAYAQTLPEPERSLRAGLDIVGGTPMARQVALVFPYVLGACVALTWLIACANVAVLLMAQWTTREQEIGVRAALGASRGRLVRHLLTEAGVIAALGGGLGIAVTFVLRTIIVANAGASELISLFDTSIKPAVMVQSVLLTMMSAALVGIAPALYETGRASKQPLRPSGVERVRQRWRHALVVAEITATVALLVVAGAIVDGYRRQVSTDLGYPTRGLMVIRVDNPAGVNVPALLEFLNGAAPGAAAGAGTTSPFGGRTEFHPVTRAGGDAASVPAEPVRVSPTYFAALGVPFRAGRMFSDDETRPGAAVAVVNESLASRLSGGQSLVGARVTLDGRDYDVVGVVADHLLNPMATRTPAIYTPVGSAGSPETSLRFLLRVPAARRELLASVRQDLPRAAPGHAVSSASAVDDIITIGGQEMLVGTVPLIPLISIGMALTATGIYAVLAFAVSRRSKEFAVRIAIGASRGDLVRLVTAHSARLAAAGALLGIAFTFALSRVVRASGGAGSMFDTPSWPAFVVPALLIFGVAAVATWVPSRRALRTDPAVLLKAD